jgi:hemerythrin-like domain-containing protein
MKGRKPVDTPTRPSPANPVEVWHVEHAYFMRLLGLLRDQVAVFESGERPRYELMEDIISYLRNYSDKYHHPREDVAFALLQKRSPDQAPVFARLRQEHRVIANAGEKLLAQLESILEDTIVPRAELEMAAATYLVYYENHISREERDVLPLAARLLTRDDWKAVASAVPGGPDPLFGIDPAEHYRDLRRQIALEA